jgi:hypothetical protein
MCPKLTRLAELVLTIPVSNAWSEKGASKVKIMPCLFKKNKTGMFVYCITDMTVTLIKNPPKNNSDF